MRTCNLLSFPLALSTVSALLPLSNDRKVGNDTADLKIKVREATSSLDNLISSPSDADSPPPSPVRYHRLSSRGLPALDFTAESAGKVDPLASGRLGFLPADSSPPSFARRRNVSVSVKERQRPQWLKQLSSISNAASILCVVDCTVLPAVTVLLPLLGEVAGAGMTKTMHAVGEMWAVGAMRHV